MNSKKLISVIVPMYNAEKYIEKCIDSIENQKYKNLEIILVDNNSSDNTLNIVKDRAQKDSRIRIYSCKKQGSSATRNVGLRLSHGQYISFVDADDVLAPNAYADSISVLTKYDPDYLLFGFYKFDENGSVNDDYIRFPEGFFDGKNYYNLALDMAFSNKGHTVPSYVYLRIIKTSILEDNHILFDEKVTRSEDFQFLMKLNLVSKSMYSMYEKKYYGYRQVANSLSHSYTPNYLNMIDIIFNDLYLFVSKIGSLEYMNRLYYRNIIYYEICAKEIILNRRLNSHQKNEMIKEMLDSSSYKKAIKKIELRDGMNKIGPSFLLFKLKTVRLIQTYIKIKG